jgi:poly(hydroxyalkanoate) granule-associated protein
MPTKPKVVEDAGESQDKEQSQMFGLLRKVVLATIGAAAIAQEEVEALVKRLVERGEIAERDGKKLVQEMMEKRKSQTVKLENDLSKNLESALEKLSVPSKADVDALGQKITALSKKIDELKKNPE